MTDLEFDGGVGAGVPHRFNLAIDSLALYTDAGFKASVGITLFMLALALAELVYTLVIFATGHPVAGWTTTMFCDHRGLFRAVCRAGHRGQVPLAAVGIDVQTAKIPRGKHREAAKVNGSIYAGIAEKQKTWVLLLLGALLGLAAFLCLYGTAPLDPPTMPGSGTATTRPTSTSITPGGWGSATAAGSSRWPRPMPWPTPARTGVNISFTDSLPWVSVLFKLLAPVLPAQFQWFGLYELAAFILQGMAAALVLGLFLYDLLPLAAGTARCLRFRPS